MTRDIKIWSCYIDLISSSVSSVGEWAYGFTEWFWGIFRREKERIMGIYTME
jgi:hypothetical protein